MNIKRSPNGEKEAARAALRLVNEQSKRENREYGIWIYLQAHTYHAGEPFTSDLAAGLTEPDVLRALAMLPNNAKRVAFAHTHGAAEVGPKKLDSENFSRDDIQVGQRFSVNLYLATPTDQLRICKLSDNPGIFYCEKLY